MKAEEFTKLIDENYARRRGIMFKKGHDYSGEEDFLSNFKDVSEICRILGIDVQKGGSQSALYFVVHKIYRICNLIKKGLSPENESVQDSFDDLKNYIDLAEGNLIDEAGMTDKLDRKADPAVVLSRASDPFEIPRWIIEHGQLIKPDKHSVTQFEPYYIIRKSQL
jgi:hypothetical protein